MKKEKNWKPLRTTACVGLVVMLCMNSAPIFAKEVEKMINVQASPTIEVNNGSIIFPNNSNYGTKMYLEDRKDSIEFNPHHNISEIHRISSKEYKYIDDRGLYESSVKVVEDDFISKVRLINEKAEANFPVKIELPDGWDIDLYRDEDNKVVDGSLVVYDDEKNVVAATTSPTAVDATGKATDTYFYFDGENLYQDVDVEDVEYPLDVSYKMVLVDTTGRFSDYFSYGEFVKRPYTSLSLGERYFDLDVVYIVDKAWDSVVREFYAVDNNWTGNLSGMRDQYMCHRNFAPTKVPWNLEPNRPDVGYVQTLAAGCNPGDPA